MLALVAKLAEGALERRQQPDARGLDIVNHALPNLDSSAKLVMSLRVEIDTLRSQLEQSMGRAPAGRSAAEEGLIREQLQQTENLLAEAQMSWGEKLRQAETLAAQRKAALESMEGQVSELTEALKRSEAARKHVEEERERLEELAAELRRRDKARAADFEASLAGSKIGVAVQGLPL